MTLLSRKNRARKGEVFSVDFNTCESQKYSGTTTAQAHLRLIEIVYF